jgi:hypothetical protein
VFVHSPPSTHPTVIADTSLGPPFPIQSFRTSVQFEQEDS